MAALSFLLRGETTMTELCCPQLYEVWRIAFEGQRRYGALAQADADAVAAALRDLGMTL